MGRLLGSTVGRLVLVFLLVPPLLGALGVQVRREEDRHVHALLAQELADTTRALAGQLGGRLERRAEMARLLALDEGLAVAAARGERGALEARLARARAGLAELGGVCVREADGALLAAALEPGLSCPPPGAHPRLWGEPGRVRIAADAPLGGGRTLTALFVAPLDEVFGRLREVLEQPFAPRLVDAQGRVLWAAASGAGWQEVARAEVPGAGLWVEAAADLRGLAHTTRLPYRVYGAAFLALHVALGGLLVLLLRGTLGPVREAARAAGRMAGGDLTVRLEARGPSEARALVGALNGMAAQLEGLYQGLEERVRERSQALAEALRRAEGLQRRAEADAAELAAQKAQLQLSQEQLSGQYALVQQKNEQLARASRLKSEFLANMSHELRTPLNAVIGFSELLLEGIPGTLNGEQREFVGDIRRSGRHLLAMVNDILDLSKIEAGQLAVTRVPQDLVQRVREAEEMARPLALKKGLALEWVAEGAVGCLGDAQRLRQVALNLLSNAVKFTPEGGRVRVEVRRVGEEAELVVADTGIGIDPGDHEAIWREFFQVQRGEARAHEGTGLGLALVRRFVEAMGGRVAVESALGSGACFRVRLPGAASPEPGRAAPGRPRTPARGARVLVAEDDEANRELMRSLLEAGGHRVRVADNGEVAVAELARELPDLLVLDLVMPGRDGFEVLEALRALPGGGACAVLVLTAQEPQGPAAERLAHARAHVVTKGSVASLDLLGCAERLLEPGAREAVS